MNVQVVYSSATGNTALLAKTIFEALPDSWIKSLHSLADGIPKVTTDLLFVGFWVDKETCDIPAGEFLETLHEKQVALFGTMGMESNSDYAKKMSDAALRHLSEENTLLGTFLCQGKMLPSVRTRYEAMHNPEDEARIQAMIERFDRAASHPDQEDFTHAAAWAQSVLEACKTA